MTVTVQRSRWPYRIGALLVGLGLLAGGGAAAWAFSAIWSVPVADHQFSPDDQTTVHLQAGQSKVIYAGGMADPQGSCTTDSAAQLRPYDGQVRVGSWRALDIVSADSTGDYPLTCTSSDDVTFSIGGDAGTTWLIGVGGALAGGTSAAVGIVLIAITAVRRRRGARARQSDPVARLG